ncbi:orotidine-5'-phosphate decarboxylase [Lentibacillus halodurans]|uniref:Orotidine 5'-phosphate decarboxylase n=1 Tax=Lentibacillus halodurans TaxID=237679 RepID=A0A1I0Z2R0_9BACI|nr:orotidine-5'-phosphate decarboxylase [Lentibacillus halodurans]SFB19386.1 orotidine-5'-phosphate decarboxylase [Lentibacillus halodurans]
MIENIYLALDFPTWEEANDFIEWNEFHGIPVKVGMELYYREGPRLIESLKENGHAIFLDLKLHDIPTTVMKAMKNIAGLGVDMVNVHALGGSDMIRRAKEGLMAGSPTNHEPKLIAVTIMTSMDNAAMNDELKIQGNLQNNVIHFADFARENGADGVVCSVHEANRIKDVCGASFLTVTPGIRLQESADDDQKRIATPAFARENGADILVAGRTITNSRNPKSAYENVQKEWLYGVE